MEFMAFKPRRKAADVRRLVRSVAIVVCAGISGMAMAQPNLGSYTGTFEVSGTQFGPAVTYRASGKLSLPVSQRSGSAITAEFLSGEAPNASVLISQWDISHTEKTKDSAGQYNSYTCSLAGPTEIPMSVTGVLDVNAKEKKHALSISLLSITELAFNCKHSRSGPYKTKKGVALTLGTGAPGKQFETQLPMVDALHLTAKFTLMPATEIKMEYGPIHQVWDLKYKQ